MMETIRFWLAFLGLLQGLPTSAALHPNSIEMGCFHRLDRLAHEPVVSRQPPDVTGLWTSYRCENRPGPEFLLRKYKFENNSSFTAQQFYYSDGDCTNPIYSVVAHGRYRPVRKSWSVPGGMETDYQMFRVFVMPYTEDMADVLDERVRKNCAFKKFEKWRAYEQQDVFNFPSKRSKVSQETIPPPERADFDCTRAINFSMHELQLIRMETRLRHPHEAREEGYHILQKDQDDTANTVQELFLGDIHTEISQRQSYRPSSYQTPLRKTKVPSTCGVCSRVFNSDLYFPPELRQRHGTMISLSGEWVSMRCEVRPHGIFLTRRLIFADANDEWEGHYAFFHDPLCRDKSYTLYAHGKYARGNPSDVISGARHYDFKVNKIKITPNDKKTTNLLNGYKGKDCGNSKWRVNIEQDVTETNGCETVGIRLPYIEYDLIKMEYRHWKSHLLIGQRPTDGQPIRSPERRPTSFQAPLVKCDKLYVAMAYTKDHDRRDVKQVDSAGAAFAKSTLTLSIFIALTVTLILT